MRSLPQIPFAAKGHLDGRPISLHLGRVAAMIAGLFVMAAAWAGNATAQSIEPDVGREEKPVQSLRLEPSLFVAVGHDDNILVSPDRTSSGLVRVTPAIQMSRRGSTWSLDSHYRFDAEHYIQQPQLSTVVARQLGSIDVTRHTSPLTTISAGSRYSATQTPSELNATTGLQVGRVPASLSLTNAEIHHRTTPQSDLSLRYEFGTTDVSQVVTGQTHALRFGAGWRMREEDQWHVSYETDIWRWNPAASVRSQVAIAGWSHRLSEASELTVDVGLRGTSDRLPGTSLGVRPEVAATVAQRMGAAGAASISYAHTLTVAVGVARPVDTDRLYVSFISKRSPRWDVNTSGGVYRDRVAGQEVVAGQLAGGIARALSRVLQVASTFDLSLNRQHLAAGVGIHENRIPRYVVTLGLRVARR